MNLALLFPAAMLAALAVILPLILHLRRRSEQVSVDFAALRWLSARMKPRRRPRLDEGLLLALRVLLIVLMALWLAQPVLRGDAGARNWKLVETTVDLAGVAELSGDSGESAHWLAPGFPSIREPRPSGLQPTASLLREYDAALGAKDGLRAFVPSEIGGLDGERTRLRREVEWRIAPAIASAADRAEPVAKMDRQVLDVRIDANSRAALRYLQAAVVAWNTPTQAMADATLPTPAITESGTEKHSTVPSAELSFDDRSESAPASLRDHLIWLRPGNLPPPILDWIRQGGTALVAAATTLEPSEAVATIWSREDGSPPIQARRLGSGRVLQWQRDLVPTAMPELLDARFADQLRAMFEPQPGSPSVAPASASQPLAGAPATTVSMRNLDPWLIALLLLVFAIERWLATTPRRMTDARA